MSHSTNKKKNQRLYLCARLLLTSVCVTSNPCQNGGSCVAPWGVPDKDDPEYYCRCPRHYSGDNCEIASPCVRDGSKCQNGGQCIDDSSAPGGYKCFCTSDFEGKHCETAKACVDGRACQNGGRCWEDVGGYKLCRCQGYHYGPHCEKEWDESQCTCQNNATCRFDPRIERGFQCLCGHRHYGDDCDRTHPCISSDPCQNGGVCLRMRTGSYLCRCPVTHEGRHCERERGSLGPGSNPCNATPNPCENGGTCVPRSFNSFVCMCPSTHYGQYCENDSPCHPTNTCQNGATCRPLYTILPGPGGRNYMCQCTPEHYGRDCENESPCHGTRNPCRNGGTCHYSQVHLGAGRLRVGNATCFCPAQHHGRYCEKESVCMQRNPCQNGGTCLSPRGPSNKDYFCRCPRLYVGDECQTKHPCTSNPCHNGATCFYDPRVSRMYSCQCSPGFTGDNCQTESYCVNGQNCQNGGTCRRFGSYSHCVCPRGIFGAVCEIKFDENECSCQNGGTCTYAPYVQRKHVCLCPLGFHGDDCELEHLCSKNSPCQNGGTCRQGLHHTYWCVCPTTHGGRHCELTKAELERPDTCSDGTRCENGGTCDSSRGGSVCRCVVGFRGARCEQGSAAGPPTTNPAITAPPPDPCRPGQHQCQNGATCLAQVGGQGYRCVCPPAWSGQYCDKESVCGKEDVKCKNGSRCRPFPARLVARGYVCVCPAGLTGPDCEEKSQIAGPIDT